MYAQPLVLFGLKFYFGRFSTSPIAVCAGFRHQDRWGPRHWWGGLRRNVEDGPQAGIQALLKP